MSMYKPDFIHANESFSATFDRYVFMMGLKELRVLTCVLYVGLTFQDIKQEINCLE